MFHVLIINAQIKTREEILFEGQAKSVVLPGQDGEFEVLDFHKPIISRLKKGVITVDNKDEFRIRDGIAKMDHQDLVIMVEV